MVMELERFGWPASESEWEVDPPRPHDSGSTLLELAVGALILGICFASLCAYASYQRNSLGRASHLSDGTQLAMSTLKSLKGRLADSASFVEQYSLTAAKPASTTETKTVNHVPYRVEVTLAHAPSPLYALRVQAKVSWKSTRSVLLGVIVPGSDSAL